MNRYFIITGLAFAFIAVSASLRVDTYPQNVPIYDRGATGLDQAMKRLRTTATVLMIGAHPDDENSALLTYFARGAGARTAYLSLTRGDGGQNAIGPELFESLGVIRTEELLQARVLDGAEQYFARAFDYGFSKTLDEARAKWPEEVIKCDVVRVIRDFRPMVVVSVFNGTTADGHGQHQYSGYITPIAIAAAADGRQCPADGPAWQVSKFYVGRGFGDQGNADISINTGEFDLALGRSYFEIALEGRSKHSSQSQGRIEAKGEQLSGLNAVPKGRFSGERSIFDGLKTEIDQLPEVVGDKSAGFVAAIVKCQSAVNAALTVQRDSDRTTLIAHLANASDTAREAYWATRDPHSKAFAYSLMKRANAALVIAAGIQIDALANTETASAMSEVSVSVKTFIPRGIDVSVVKTEIITPPAATVTRVSAPEQQQGGRNRSETGVANEFYTVKLPANTPPSEPYWLSQPRSGDLFAWPNTADRGSPFSPDLITAKVTVAVAGKNIELMRPVEYRYADLTRGELRSDLNVVPRLSIEPERSLIVIPSGKGTVKQPVGFSVRNHEASVKIDSVGISGTRSNTALNFDKSITMSGINERRAFTIEREFDAAPGTYILNFYATSGGQRYDREMVTIAYPHIRTRRYYRAATTTVKVIDMNAERRRIGYVMGPGDEVPAAIEQMGFDLKLLNEADLASGDLDQFDTVVVGIRGYESRDDLVSANGRLLDYVRRGGNLIVQYQRHAAFFQSMMPLPATVGPRVADETAPVKILVADHPFFTTPNRIRESDFDGWVQERNLYSLRTFDAGYQPLLAANDPGEPENNGGLVNAQIGDGNYTYCSYAFFRQLPAGVDGAYRLFANMLSRPRSIR